MKKLFLFLLGSVVGYGVSVLLKEEDVQSVAKKKLSKIRESLEGLESEFKEKKDKLLEELSDEENPKFYLGLKCKCKCGKGCNCDEE